MKVYHMKSLDEVQVSRIYDVFLCANGLEGRDTRVVKLFQEKGFSVKKWIVFNYAERNEKAEIGRNEENVSDCLSGEKVIHITTSYNDTRSYMEILREAIDDVKSAEYLGIDITGFKNQFFFPIFKFLRNSCCTREIDTFYTEPATYKFPKKKERIAYFPNVQEDTKVLFNFSKAQEGIEIKSIPGFEGERGKKTLLIIILGFDGKVATRIKEEYNAEKVLLINGFPAYLPKFRDISLINNKELVSTCSKEDIFNTYADNPFELYNVLHRIMTKYPEYKLLIAPLGAKPLALGVCKFVLDYPQMAVLYVESSKYVEKSTEKFGETWEYHIDLT